MLDILEYLTKELKKVCPRVYDTNASKDAVFPYIVFDLPSTSSPETDNDLVVLEINIWDESRDSYDVTKNIEVLTNRAEELFKFNRELGEDYLLIFSKINRLRINDPETNITRRQLRYTIKYYNK